MVLQSEYLMCLQVKFVKLFYKYNDILAEHRVASFTNSEITNELYSGGYYQ
jgi:hypothetical protein